MPQGNRLSAQNYCTHCSSRIKNEKGKTWCTEYNRPVNISISICRLLKPFDKYKELKESK